VSSGTWTVISAHGAELKRLREERDMLANIDAFRSSRGNGSLPGAAGNTKRLPAMTPLTRQPTLESLKGVLKKRALACPRWPAPAGRSLANEVS